MNKVIEVEYRACLKEKEYLRIRDYLKKNASDHNRDDKHTHFFIWKDKVAKVVYSDEHAKISMKPGRVGKTHMFPETEIMIKPSEAKSAIAILKQFEPVDIHKVFQFRHNFIFRDVSIALKYTESWGFHIELEVMISSENEKHMADKAIKNVAEELDVKIMNNRELTEYTKEIDSGHNFGEYSENNYPYRND